MTAVSNKNEMHSVTVFLSERDSLGNQNELSYMNAFLCLL